MDKFIDTLMAAFLVMAVLAVPLVVVVAVYQVTHQAEMIKQQDKACYNGCQTSHDPQFCYKACMTERADD